MSEMENSWVTFELNHQEYGIRTEFVKEMVLLSKPSKLPDSPDFMRGIINLRGLVIPAIDLRKRLGMASFQDEIKGLIDLLMAREQDHINWLQELQKSVEEKREFKLTTDPHKCAFGKWYDTFLTNNQLLRIQLNKFDIPHKKIHALGETVKEYEKKQMFSEALELVTAAWGRELAVVREIFDETIKILKDSVREIVIISECNSNRIGFIVDSVTEVLDIPNDNIEPSPRAKEGKASRYIHGMGKIGNGLKVLLNVNELLSGDEIEQLGCVAP